MNESSVLKQPARVTGPTKVLFYGNCQSNATATALSIMNPDIDVRYAGNSQRVVEYDPERSERLMDWCDIIVSQPIMNVGNADHYELLAEKFGDRLIFMPYVYFDAFFFTLLRASYDRSDKNRRCRRTIGYSVAIDE